MTEPFFAKLFAKRPLCQGLPKIAKTESTAE
jgi:hypothetical protein